MYDAANCQDVVVTNPVPEPRRALRDTQEGIFGGVCAGLAEHFAAPVKWVRLVCFVLVLVKGFGIFLYAALWMFLPAKHPEEPATPGLAAATRLGFRPSARPKVRDIGVALALILLLAGVLALFSNRPGSLALMVPAGFAVVGIGLLWWQADEAQVERWRDNTRRLSPLEAIVGRGGPIAWLRLLAGLGLLAMALILAVLLLGAYANGILVSMVAVGLGLLGLAVVLGPSMLRMSTDLSAEREARIRTQERADMAAHLHDSVLQTLALIQRSADDPARVTTLARTQERSLRTWLFEQPGAQSLASELQQIAQQAEEEFATRVEVVCVNDRAVGERERAVLGAAREAITNAAKHSGASAIDVYAEVNATQIEIFVRDRGTGFDPQAIAADRHGVKESIIGRMQRYDGQARIRSNDTGTEVRLTMPLETA